MGEIEIIKFLSNQIIHIPIYVKYKTNCTYLSVTEKVIIYSPNICYTMLK